MKLTGGVYQDQMQVLPDVFLPRKIVQSLCRKVRSEGILFSLIIGSCLILVDMFSRWSVQIMGALLGARAKRMKHQWQ